MGGLIGTATATKDGLMPIYRVYQAANGNNKVTHITVQPCNSYESNDSWIMEGILDYNTPSKFLIEFRRKVYITSNSAHQDYVKYRINSDKSVDIFIKNGGLVYYITDITLQHHPSSITLIDAFPEDALEFENKAIL